MSAQKKKQEVSRVSAFNPGHLSGRAQDANYFSFQLQSRAPRVTERHCLDAMLKHNLAGNLFCCITRVQLRQTSVVMISRQSFQPTESELGDDHA